MSVFDPFGSYFINEPGNILKLDLVERGLIRGLLKRGYGLELIFSIHQSSVSLICCLYDLLIGCFFDRLTD